MKRNYKYVIMFGTYKTVVWWTLWDSSKVFCGNKLVKLLRIQITLVLNRVTLNLSFAALMPLLSWLVLALMY